jgi:hypothetical protein
MTGAFYTVQTPRSSADAPESLIPLPAIQVFWRVACESENLLQSDRKKETLRQINDLPKGSKLRRSPDVL